MVSEQSLMNFCVVIPLFNESVHIRKVIQNITPYKLNVIIVDDGSTDLSSLLAFKSKITLLKHTVNLGKGAAMKTGAEYAFLHGYEAVIFMDADGQHNARDIPGFVSKISSGKYDVVFGSRNLKYGAPLIRYLGNKVASYVIKAVFGIYVSDPLCGYRAITKRAYNKIKWESPGYGVESEMLARVAKNNLKFTETPVDTIYHDKNKGVTILDAFGVLLDVLKWRITP